jgi:hypothetical protein
MKIGSAATVALSLALSLLACEVIVRLMDRMPLWPQDMAAHKASFVATETAAEYDPLLGWRQRAYVERPGLTTGELGIRTNNHAVTPLEPRGVLVVGDSFTAGSDVGNHESYPAQLERLLQRPVINAGVGGYGTDQMVLMAETLLPRLEPSALVVGILDDDINRAALKIYGGAPKPWFDVGDGELVHHNNPVPAPSVRDGAPPLWWLAYSYLAVWTTERLGIAHLWRPGSYVLADNDPVAVSCALLARLKQTTDARGIPLYVVMLFTGSERITTMDIRIEKSRPLAVIACARRLGITAIDLLPELIALARRDMSAYRSLYHLIGPHRDIYGHMTAAGNAFIAHELAAYLTRDTPSLQLTPARNETADRQQEPALR